MGVKRRTGKLRRSVSVDFLSSPSFFLSFVPSCLYSYTPQLAPSLNPIDLLSQSRDQVRTTMADADTLQTRKAHTTHNNHPDDESTSVPIVESHSGADQYPNPFQQHVGQAQGRHHQQQQQHYNVMIPTVDHWPAIFLDGLKTSAQFAVLGLKQAHTKWQEYQSSRDRSYQVLPTTTIDPRSQQHNTPTRQIFTFGSKRQQKGGHQFSVSGRRLTRLLFLLVLTVTTILLLVLPHRLNPLEDRAIWIRYYSHEEAIKIMVPYGIKLHVSDSRRQR